MTAPLNKLVFIETLLLGRGFNSRKVPSIPHCAKAHAGPQSLIFSARCRRPWMFAVITLRCVMLSSKYSASKPRTKSSRNTFMSKNALSVICNSTLGDLIGLSEEFEVVYISLWHAVLKERHSAE